MSNNEKDHAHLHQRSANDLIDGNMTNQGVERIHGQALRRSASFDLRNRSSSALDYPSPVMSSSSETSQSREAPASAQTQSQADPIQSLLRHLMPFMEDIRDANLNNDASALPRSLMLFEAIFAKIRPYLPAPKEVVECLPVKLYTRKCQKQENDEAALCSICLVEYEEGDSMRVMPCHHEFHVTCIDKWLKEVRRVCPLCRQVLTNSVYVEKCRLKYRSDS